MASLGNIGFSIKLLFLLLLFLFGISFNTYTQGKGKQPQKPRVLNLHEVVNPKVYPKALKEHPQEGRIVIDIWLNPEGEVIKYKIVDANNKQLQLFLEQRIRKLIFSPAKNKYGTNQYGKVRLPFEFVLPQKVGSTAISEYFDQSD